jgi:hypothetical protein
MNEEELQDAWRRERAAIEPPPGFADTVMRSIHGAQQRAWPVAVGRIAMLAWDSTAVRIGVCVLAAAGWMIRLGVVGALLLPASVGH